MNSWLTRIAEQLHVTDPLLALCLILMLIVFLLVSLARFKKTKLSPSVAKKRFIQLVDQSIESGRAHTFSLAHQGLGTSALVSSIATLHVAALESERINAVGLQAAQLSGDGVIAAAAMEQSQKIAGAGYAGQNVLYAGPDPFLTTANILAGVATDNPLYTYGQASPETILLTTSAKITDITPGGAPAPLSGLLLGEKPQEAVFSENYYTDMLDPSTNIRTIHLHNILRSLILVGLIIGAIFMYLGIV